MLELIVFGLFIACAVLFQRLMRAEQLLGELEQKQAEHTWRILALATREPGEEPAAKDPEVAEVEPDPQRDPVPEERPAPAVTLRSSDEDIATQDATEHEEAPAASEPEIAEETPSYRFQLDFEDVFGRRLPIWAGGITLAVAGVFLVRYSIEAGLLTPVVRVAMSFLFGLGLLGAAEAAFRFEDRVGDHRVRQALAGAGLATLYAAFYLAGTQYELIGQTFAFLGLASVTALAIWLSYRFGLPSAVLGLIGGFAAPALVGGEDANLPMLALYLALVTGGLTQTANRQRRSWLGLGALAGGLGWGGLLLIGGNYDFSDILALGLYFILLGTLVPALLDIEKFEQPIRLAAAGAAGLQLAVLVDKGGYQPLAWGLYLLLGAALAWFGWRKPEMRAGNAMAATIGIALLALWPSPDPVFFAMVATSLAVLFAGVPLAHIQRDDSGALEALSAAAVSLAVGLVILSTFGSVHGDAVLLWEAIGLFALAALPAYAAKLLWDRKVKGELAANLSSAGLLLFFASVCLLPDKLMPFAASAIATGLAYLLRGRFNESRSLSTLVWMAAIGTFLTVLISLGRFEEIERLVEGVDNASILSLLRWIAGVLPFAAIALFQEDGRRRAIAEFIGGILLFGALAQVLPPIWLAWAAVVIILGIRLRLADRGFAALALALCVGLWAILPASDWLGEGLHALAGEAMLVTKLPDLREVFGFLLPFTLSLGIAASLLRRYLTTPLDLAWLAAIPAFLVLHTLFKQLLMIDSQPDFAVRGLAERTLWGALLLALAWATMKQFKQRYAATAIALIALAHFLYFTVMLHNPLWAHQAVGPVPIANLVLAAYAVGIGALLSLRLWWPDWRRVTDIAIMLLATLGAMTLLRQIFAGTYLDTLPMSQTEDLLRSLVGIVVAIAFLLIGSARGDRLWRLGSLVLMTGTVLKVFVVDTAGLEGLLRIASFVALGGSLIGIGWFYSRQLKAEPQAD